MQHILRATVAAATLMVPVLTATSTGAQPSAGSEHESATYTVTVENLTEGQYLTPPNVAVHDRSVDVFSRNRPAGSGVQAVAENGNVPLLAAELHAAIDDEGLGASVVGGGAPIGPGGATTFQIASDGNRLSLVSMLICTNDGFAGIDSRPLVLQPGQSRSIPVGAFDAGTEVNTELDVDIVPAPFCLGDHIGAGESNPLLAENGVIRPHHGIQGVGDFGAAFDWQGPVARVTITRES